VEDFFVLAPIFARQKSEKFFKPAGNPMEALASQFTLFYLGEKFIKIMGAE